MIKIKVGLDPEFMVKYNGDYTYPILRDPKNFASRDDYNALFKIDMDEFGHCAEIRPTEGTTGKEVVLNTIDTMASLPALFKYYSDNTHQMDKKTFIKVLRKIGRKDLSESKNIYDVDILDDCAMDLKVRQAGKRLLFCGCHMHLSAEESFNHQVKGESVRITRNHKLPVKALVWLFDNLIFACMEDDKHFNVGRYRRTGFYELKGHGGFEYRSLGASALTPTRIRLISDLMIKITETVIANLDEYVFLTAKPGVSLGNLTFSQEVHDMLIALAKTKSCTSDLRKLWVPFD